MLNGNIIKLNEAIRITFIINC